MNSLLFNLIRIILIYRSFKYINLPSNKKNKEIEVEPVPIHLSIIRNSSLHNFLFCTMFIEHRYIRFFYIITINIKRSATVTWNSQQLFIAIKTYSFNWECNIKIWSISIIIMYKSSYCLFEFIFFFFFLNNNNKNSFFLCVKHSIL